MTRLEGPMEFRFRLGQIREQARDDALSILKRAWLPKPDLDELRNRYPGLVIGRARQPRRDFASCIELAVDILTFECWETLSSFTPEDYGAAGWNTQYRALHAGYARQLEEMGLIHTTGYGCRLTSRGRGVILLGLKRGKINRPHPVGTVLDPVGTVLVIHHASPDDPDPTNDAEYIRQLAAERETTWDT